MALDEHRAFQLTYRIMTKAAEEKWVSEQGQGVFSPDGELVAVEGFITDITQRKALEEAFFTEKERTEVTLHSIGDAVISTDAAGFVTYLNTTAEQLTGWPAADAAGRALPEVFRIIDVNTRAAVENPGALAMRVGKSVDLTATCVLIRRDQSEVPVEDSAAPIRAKDGRVTGAVIVFRDASAQRAWSMKMAHLAQYDVLTDLPNRTLLDDRINHAVAAARRTHTRLAILFIDLDRFKHINDSLGHARGDAVLQSVAARLLACVRASDTVGRRGGDEFVVILTDLERPENAASSAEKILVALSQPHEIAGHVLHVTASVGISIYPDDAGDADALISAADAAMYHAKQTEHSSWQFFTTQMNTRWVARRSLEQSLRDAVRRHEFILHYQPKVNLDTLAMTGVEALVRWQHPTFGLLAPGEFIGVAEESGLILPIGRWVLREACRQTRDWEAAGLRPHPISVNVSAVEFRAKGFLAHVASVLRDTALDPQCLELEVTESALMTRAESTTGVLHALKDLGVQLAIDDFGTGYSSLSYLSRFPIDTLKIDRSFVHGIGRTEHDATIISAVIGIGRSLQQRVVAEGVETKEQLALLRAYQCGEGQGYYFSRPVAAAQFADLLRRELHPTRR
jgi:diguanylate cyclase (GGDEF)-like protein/PAS domain S-box-containing protein